MYFFFQLSSVYFSYVESFVLILLLLILVNSAIYFEVFLIEIVYAPAPMNPSRLDHLISLFSSCRFVTLCSPSSRGGVAVLRSLRPLEVASQNSLNFS
jgi:hypothetical protein